MAYKCGVLLGLYIHQMLRGVVYLFHNKNSTQLKQILLVLCLNIFISGCSTIMYREKPKPERFKRLETIKKVIIKKLSFLPYIDYIPNVNPTKPALTMLNELSKYEKIVDDHVEFDYPKEEDISSESKRKRWLNNLIRRGKKEDSIEEKIYDINEIRKLTSRYEKWGLAWDEKATLVEKDLSLDEIYLIKSEIKRISKKL